MRVEICVRTALERVPKSFVWRKARLCSEEQPLGHEGGEACEEVERLEEHVGGTVAVGGLERMPISSAPILRAQ